MIHLLASLLLAIAPAGPEVTVYDQTLTPVTGMLVSVTDRRVLLVVEGRDRTIDNAAAIIIRGEPSPAPDAADIGPRIQFDLTDGQRWIKPLATVKFTGERVLTPLSPAAAPLKLDQIRRVTFGVDASPLTAVPASDTVRLRSGDTLTGFVAGIDTTGDAGEFAIRLEQGTSGSAPPRTIRHDTLRSLTLTNPPATAGDVRVWLADGQRLAASTSFTGAEWTLTPLTKGTEPLKIGATSLRAALLASNAITPLSSLTMKADTSGDSAPALGPESPLGLRDISIPEPQSVSWALPASASRLSLTIALREDCLAWGDCGVSLTLARGGKATELLRTTLNAGQPSAALAAELPGFPAPGQLTVTIDAGRHGPVQDRVVIRNAMLGTGK